MERGYDDGVWNVALSKLLELGWKTQYLGYFGHRVSWSHATCPQCVIASKIEAKRPKTLLERIELLEQKIK